MGPKGNVGDLGLPGPQVIRLLWRLCFVLLCLRLFSLSIDFRLHFYSVIHLHTSIRFRKGLDARNLVLACILKLVIVIFWLWFAIFISTASYNF